MRLARTVTVLMMAAGGLVAAPGAAQAVTSIDLLTSADSQIDGAAASDASGIAAGGDTDFNRDGKRDLLIGATGADPAGRSAAGGAWVVFGNPAALLDLAGLGPAGVRIDGAGAGDGAGVSVSDAGDVNADGIDDVIVGAWGADPAGRADAGIAYVLFGSVSPPATIDLAQVGAPGGPPGFRILGAVAADFAGISVSDAGNVNGDENDDVIVGANGHDPPGRIDGGSAYVVFGKSNNSDVDLNALGAGGYEIRGATAGDFAGTSVANGGDVTLDTRPDQLVGAPSFDGTQGVDSGAMYVSAGKINTTAVDLASLGAAGYRVEGVAAGDGAGSSVDNAGDVSLDGRPDQVYGAPDGGTGLEGAAYIAYGLQPVAPGQPSAKLTRYVIAGASPGDLTGWSVAGLGNVDSGIRPDQVIGAPGSANGGRSGAGAAYVVYGKLVASPPSAAVPVDLSTYTDGYRIDGAAVDAVAGASVAGPGNVGGSSARDVFLGASKATANARSRSGSSYVVFGTGFQFQAVFIGLVVNPVIRAPRAVAAPAPLRVAAVGASPGIRFTLRQPARVKLRILRILPGRRVGVRRRARGIVTGNVRCAAGAPRGRRSRERACTRFLIHVNIDRVFRTAGAKVVPFDGRIRGRALPKGRYRLEALVRDRAGRVHGPFRVKFRIE